LKATVLKNQTTQEGEEFFFQNLCWFWVSFGRLLVNLLFHTV